MGVSFGSCYNTKSNSLQFGICFVEYKSLYYALGKKISRHKTRHLDALTRTTSCSCFHQTYKVDGNEETCF